MSTIPGIDTARGRTRISSRAVSRVVVAVAAEALGVKPGRVSVDLADAAGALDVTVRVPRRALPVDDGPATADATDDDAIRARTEHTQQQVRSTAGELTGIRFGGVTVRLTANRLHRPGRVA